jgi:hypothetical protein
MAMLNNQRVTIIVGTCGGTSACFETRRNFFVTALCDPHVMATCAMLVEINTSVYPSLNLSHHYH